MMRLEWGAATEAAIDYATDEEIATIAEVLSDSDGQKWLVISFEEGGIAIGGTRKEIINLLEAAVEVVWHAP